MRAIVIDDSRSMRVIVTRALAQLGVTDVVQASNGQEAIDVITAGPMPDVALIDWHMPVMDGYHFIKAVRKMPECRSMTLMMVTSENQPDLIVRALAAGAHEYLIKPFTPDALADKLYMLGVAEIDESQLAWEDGQAV